MLITFDKIYQNVKRVPKDLTNKALLESVYKDPEIRPIIESLYLDNDTPPELYDDLVGFTLTDIENYRLYYFSLPADIPRLPLKQLIKSIPSYFNSKRDLFNVDLYQKLFEMVYTNGWAMIDKTYNKGKRINITTVSSKIMKKMLATLTTFPDQLSDTENLGQQKQLCVPFY